MRNSILAIGIIIVLMGCAGKSKKTRDEIIQENIFNDSLRICKYVREEMQEQLLRGNIYWFKDFNNFVHAEEYLNINYGIVLFPINKRYHCAIKMLDSIIAQKYGNEFYQNIEKEILVRYKDIPDHLNIDKCYYFAEESPEYPGGIDSLYSDIYRKIPFMTCQNIDLRYGSTIIINFVIETDGEIKRAKVFQKLCPDIDNKVIEVIKNLPKKWKPAIFEKKRVPYLMNLNIDWNNKVNE